MRDYIIIGSSPAEEECVQVGSQYYMRRSRIVCNAYIDAIRKKLGEEPAGANLELKLFDHDFGRYTEVVCYFDDGNGPAMEYAFRCESDAPTTWAEVGMIQPN